MDLQYLISSSSTHSDTSRRSFVLFALRAEIMSFPPSESFSADTKVPAMMMNSTSRSTLLVSIATFLFHLVIFSRRLDGSTLYPFESSHPMSETDRGLSEQEFGSSTDGDSKRWRPNPGLPWFQRWTPTPKPEAADYSRPPSSPMESCGFKLLMGTAGGAGMGFFLGLFLGAMGDMQPMRIINGREVPQGPLREQARAAYVQTAERSLSLARNFASFSAIFMGTECVIEKIRGKSDIMNPVYAGCATGAAFGIRQGPGAACFGCAGMAAFTIVLEKIMGH